MRRILRPAFSLAELMIALAILGIGLLFIAAALPVGISYSRDSVDFSAAAGAADEAFQTLEGLRISRHLKSSLVKTGGVWPADYPAGAYGGGFYPARLDNLFRPRLIPPGAYPNPANGNFPYGIKLEPREGSFDHPFCSPAATPGYPPLGDSRNDGYEPYFKTRVLTAPNLSFARRGVGPASSRQLLVDDCEESIGRYLAALGLLNTDQLLLEFDATSRLINRSYSIASGPQPIDSDIDFRGESVALVDNLPFSPLLRFFPAVTPTIPFRAERFAPAGIDPETNAASIRERYWTRNVPNAVNDPLNRPTGYSPVEFDKAADRRITWTALYRRMQFDSVAPGPNGTYDGPNEVNQITPPWATTGGDDVYLPGDRQLYELIVIVTRKPSTRHRFARQDVSSGQITDFEQPTAVINPANNDTRGGDRVAPTPWLVIADTRIEPDHVSSGPGDPDGIMQGLLRRITTNNTLSDSFDDSAFPRPLSPNFVERSTLKFAVRSSVGRLLAPGSVLIPAANDNFPHIRPTPVGPANFARPEQRIAGFVPHVPDSLPIYEVLEVIPDAPGSGTDRTTVVVKNNGSYPWVNTNAPAPATRFFPFWVIPPAFVERDSNDQPIFERTSPILGIYRKIIRIPEVP